MSLSNNSWSFSNSECWCLSLQASNTQYPINVVNPVINLQFWRVYITYVGRTDMKMHRLEEETMSIMKIVKCSLEKNKYWCHWSGQDMVMPWSDYNNAMDINTYVYIVDCSYKYW